MSRRKDNYESCNGWKNWDTWSIGVCMNNDRRVYNLVRLNYKEMLKLPKKLKLNYILGCYKAFNNNCAPRINKSKVSAKELNSMIREIGERK